VHPVSETVSASGWMLHKFTGLPPCFWENLSGGRWHSNDNYYTISCSRTVRLRSPKTNDLDRCFLPQNVVWLCGRKKLGLNKRSIDHKCDPTISAIAHTLIESRKGDRPSILDFSPRVRIDQKSGRTRTIYRTYISTISQIRT
jgi:hypothetical protein